MLICCFGVYRLLIASNKMNDERISHIQLLFKPNNKALLHFKGTPEDDDKWKEQINKFLERKSYSRDKIDQTLIHRLFLAYHEQHPNRQKCDYDNPPAPGKSCEFNLETLGPCTPNKNFGLGSSKACVILKLRRNPEWSPEFYNSSDKLPEKMPADLKNFIKHFPSGSLKVCVLLTFNRTVFFNIFALF